MIMKAIAKGRTHIALIANIALLVGFVFASSCFAYKHQNFSIYSNEYPTFRVTSRLSGKYNPGARIEVGNPYRFFVAIFTTNSHAHFRVQELTLLSASKDTILHETNVEFRRGSQYLDEYIYSIDFENLILSYENHFLVLTVVDDEGNVTDITVEFKCEPKTKWSNRIWETMSSV